MRCVRKCSAWLACGVLSATLAACSDATSSGTVMREACDPFELESHPGSLAMVLAAGHDMSGVIFVVDETEDGDVRAFVGSETRLSRLPVSGGSGSNTGDFERITVLVEAQPRSYQLIVERSATETRIARSLDLTQRDPSIDGLPASDELTVVDPESLEDAQIIDAMNAPLIEYLARLPSDELLLVTSVRNPDVDYDSFRVFVGTDESLVEHEVTEVTRARDGGSTHVVFTLDGSTADAFFPVDLTGENPQPATLEHGGDTVEIERLDPALYAAELPDADFECLR